MLHYLGRYTTCIITRGPNHHRLNFKRAHNSPRLHHTGSRRAYYQTPFERQSARRRQNHKHSTQKRAKNSPSLLNKSFQCQSFNRILPLSIERSHDYYNFQTIARLSTIASYPYYHSYEKPFQNSSYKSQLLPSDIKLDPNNLPFISHIRQPSN